MDGSASSFERDDTRRASAADDASLLERFGCLSGSALLRPALRL